MQIGPAVLCALLSPSAALPVSFNAARAYAVPVSAGAIAVADFNGDGNLDLAVVDGAGGLSILLGDGKGGLRFAVEYPAGYGTSVAAADFNGDGKADLAVASQEDGVAIFIGNGDGSFQPPIYYPLAGSLPSSIAGGDFNGDGKLDLVDADSFPTPSQCCWATATVRFKRPCNTLWASRRVPWRWPISMATESPTWRWPLRAIWSSCWATATVRSSLL
jgi:hypothetical protein